MGNAIPMLAAAAEISDLCIGIEIRIFWRTGMLGKISHNHTWFITNTSQSCVSS